MTEQKITAPAQSDNRDAKFINFTEGFGKAKRTSLTWSALTLVVAAAPHWNENVRVMGTAIPYSQGALAALLLVVAIFYFAGFLRALSIVTVQNSKAAEEANETWNTLDKVVKGWRTKLDPVTKDIAEVEGLAKSIREATEGNRGRIDDFAHSLSNQITRIEKAIEERKTRAFRQEETDHTEFAHYFHRIGPEVSMLNEILNNGVAAFKADYDSDSKLALHDASELKENLAAAGAKIDKLESSLHTFRDAIDKPEKHWHRWHDKLAVFTLFGFAILAVATRLVIGNPIDIEQPVYQVEILGLQSPDVNLLGPLGQQIPESAYPTQAASSRGMASSASPSSRSAILRS